MTNRIEPQPGERFTGHGAEWRDANLSPQEARIATSWVELKIDKRSMLTTKQRVEDVRDIMDDLLEAAGAENVEFPLKTACCGGAHTLSDSDTSTRLVLNILRGAELAGADVIATECPTCHSGLEMHQVRAEKVLGERTTVKVLYFTQLLGIALGLSPRSLGIHENVSDGLAALEVKGLT